MPSVFPLTRPPAQFAPAAPTTSPLSSAATRSPASSPPSLEPTSSHLHLQRRCKCGEAPLRLRPSPPRSPPPAHQRPRSIAPPDHHPRWQRLQRPSHHAPRLPPPSPARTPPSDPPPLRTGPCLRPRFGRSPLRARPQLPLRLFGMGLAVCLPLRRPLGRSSHRRPPPTPHSSLRPATRRQEGRPPRRDPQTRHVPYPTPFLRHPSP